MRKTKRWKLENAYYGSGDKFDRNYIKNYEGSHLPFHRMRERRNWRYPQTWIPNKYTLGLINKYIGKPIEALEEAYQARVKNVKNPESFKEAYQWIIYDFCDTRAFRRAGHYKYILVDGIITKNPDYIKRKPYKRFTAKHLAYNEKHIINPGKVRRKPIDTYSKASSNMITKQPIYLGKLYVSFADGPHLMDVYHYAPEFDKWRVMTDRKLAEKKQRFEETWIPVKIGIHSLNCYVEEPNPKIPYYKDRATNTMLARWVREEAREMLKILPETVINNYGIGSFLNPVIKRKDVPS